MVVGVEIAHHQGVSAEVSLEEGGKEGRMVRWTAGGGRDVEVDDGYCSVVDGDCDALMFGDIVAGEEGVRIYG